MNNTDRKYIWHYNHPTVFSLQVELEGHNFSVSTFLGVICRKNGRYDILRKSDGKVLCRNIKNENKLISTLKRYAEDIVKKEAKNIENILLCNR